MSGLVVCLTSDRFFSINLKRIALKPDKFMVNIEKLVRFKYSSLIPIKKPQQKEARKLSPSAVAIFMLF